jgi:hypothetical protein
MPSRLTGTKSEVFEGGVRNFLAVQGPGVQAGVTDSTLLDITGMLYEFHVLHATSVITPTAPCWTSQVRHIPISPTQYCHETLLNAEY